MGISRVIAIALFILSLMTPLIIARRRGLAPPQKDELPVSWVYLISLDYRHQHGRRARETLKSLERDIARITKKWDKDRKSFWKGESDRGAKVWYYSFFATKTDVDMVFWRWSDVISAYSDLARVYDYRRRSIVSARSPTQGTHMNKVRRDMQGKVNVTSPFLSPITSGQLVRRARASGSRDSNIEHQAIAGRDLLALSKAPWGDSQWAQMGYLYDKTQGKGALVYVICKGADVSHPEFDHIKPSLLNRKPKYNWLWSAPFPGTGKDKYRDYSWGHGTAVLSKIVGGSVGIARSASFTIVVNCDKNGKSSLLHLLDSLLRIEHDIRKRRHKQVIISSSFLLDNLKRTAGTLDEFNEALIVLIIEAIRSLSAFKNVLFVTPSGTKLADRRRPNHNIPENQMDQLPATLIERPGFSNFLIPVGGVDMNVWENQYQLHRLLEIWAPASFVMVAANNRSYYPTELPLRPHGTMHGYASGTSYAAAIVTGLLAYFVGLGFTAAEAKILLLGYATTTQQPSPFEEKVGINIVANTAQGICENGNGPQGPLELSVTRDLAKRKEFRILAQDLIRLRRINSHIHDNHDGILRRTSNFLQARNSEPFPDTDSPKTTLPYGLACPARSTSSTRTSSTSTSTSSTSSSNSQSTSLSTSHTDSRTQTTAKTTGTVTSRTKQASSVSNLGISTQPTEDEPTPVDDEPAEPVETFIVDDEPVVGELTELGSDILYIIPPLAIGVGVVAIIVPLLNGKTSTLHVSLSEYAMKTITLTDASNLNIKIPTKTALGQTTIYAPETATDLRITHTLSSMLTRTAPSTARIRSSPRSTINPATITKISSLSPSIKASSLSSSRTVAPTEFDSAESDEIELPAERQICHGLYKAERNATSPRWVLYLPNKWYYLKRDDMATVISNAVCDDINQHDIEKPGSVEKTFFNGSPEMVDFYYSWQKIPPLKDECKNNFLSILDGCDGNDPANPYNWKGGGERFVGTNLYFKIQPRWPWRKPPGAPFAACWYRVNLEDGEAIATIWGYGWNDAFDDWITKPDGTSGRKARGPEEFFNSINGCRWDGRWWYTASTPEPRSEAKWEWKLQIGFQTNWFVDPRAVLSQRCVEDAVKKFSGIQDFSCGDKDLEAAHS